MAELGSDYQRPKEGFRFKFDGIKTNSVADSLPPDKYPYAQNIRTHLGSSVRARAGLHYVCPTTAAYPITDLSTYASLSAGGIDNEPFVVARNAADAVYASEAIAPGASTLTGTLASSTLYPPSPGASMIPFRPAESPNPWMYVANGSDYQKFSAPAAGAVTQQKVGIAEPQTPCEAAIDVTNFATYQAVTSGGATAGGNAGSLTNTARVTDTVQSVFVDPAGNGGPGVPFLYTLGVTSTQIYSRWMALLINSAQSIVQDVYPYQPNPISISAIYYYAGSTGRCVVVHFLTNPGPGTSGESLYTQNILGVIRRGSLITFSGGSETCLVLSVTEGPDGS